MARILIAANDVVAARMAGPGIRCVELGTQLSLAGHAVTILGIEAPANEFPGLSILPPVSDSGMAALVSSYDAVVLEGLALVRYPSLRRARIPLIVDLYDPFPLALLEQEARRSAEERNREEQHIRGALVDLLRLGDFFICASERQRDLWIGALLSAGRVNPANWDRDNSLRGLIDVVPFGIPDGAAPIRTTVDRQMISDRVADDDTVLLWAGGIYNWFDPLTVIRAVGQLAPEYPTIKLVFMSTSHPHREVPRRMWMPQRASELATSLGLNGTSVLFNDGWVPYAERGAWLAAADCGVSTHFDHLETRYSFRTRMLDYLWAGLPIICSDGDYFADLVRTHELGWVVPPEDEAALVRAIRALVEGGSPVAQMRRRVTEVAGTMRWSEVAEPLRVFCGTLLGAADRPRELHRVEGQLSRHVGSVGRFVRLGNKGLRQMRAAGPRSAAREAVRWWRGRTPRA